MIAIKKYVVSNNEFRKFSAILATSFFGIATWLYWRNGNISMPLIVTIGVFLISAAFMPRVIAPFYSFWMSLGNWLGWFNTRLILAIMYFLILTPTGLLRRVLRKNGLNLKTQPNKKSYAIISKKRISTHFDWTF